jgi:hypothetical protein
LAELYIETKHSYYLIFSFREWMPASSDWVWEAVIQDLIRGQQVAFLVSRSLPIQVWYASRYKVMFLVPKF